jgi:mannose-6-phosphate isomerase-like protein (cupin superfamily)
MSEYASAHLDEIDEVTDGRAPWRAVRHHFGIRSFGVNAWTGANVGDRIINEHVETTDDVEDDEELYFVHSGRAAFELDGERVDAPAGTFVFVPPPVKRTAFAEEPGTTIVAFGGRPGQVYMPWGWDVWRPLQHLYNDKKYDECIGRGRALVAENADYPLPLYNLACCESLAGHKDEAIEHLGLAIERFEGFRQYAANDSDFESIRDEPAFKELVGA